jgi:hypothetical protein
MGMDGVDMEHYQKEHEVGSEFLTLGWVGWNMDQNVGHVAQVEKFGLPGLNVEEGVQRLSETVVLKWICYFKHSHSPWKGP